MSTDMSEPKLFLSSMDSATGIMNFKGFNPKNLKIVEEFPVQADDIFIWGFPKSGNIWTFTIITAILNQDDLDAFLKTDYKKPGFLIEICPNAALKFPRPGVFMSHLPFDLLPKGIHEMKTKIINIIRNPKDVAVSYFHFHKVSKRFLSYAKPWNDFFEDFINGSTVYGSYFRHIRTFKRVHNEPNIFKVEYEDLKKEPGRWIAKMAEFLGKPLSDEKLMMVTEITGFDHMKQNPNMNSSHKPIFVEGESFMRKGLVGDWRSIFTKEQDRRMDEEYIKLCEEIDRPVLKDGTD